MAPVQILYMKMMLVYELFIILKRLGVETFSNETDERRHLIFQCLTGYNISQSNVLLL